ncbi:Cloroperoxidase [Sistotremastrum niveocremeum HHB9708]|uniref:Cloroperoxidase n=1 Tax=Sistotremastrum niveocremeum HHB9708 TaxID=1314777 RepID=A0A164WP74_9AGAM|nr:Cloroperoxidase [Sistotremastrum niveocremeum HHB9708]
MFGTLKAFAFIAASLSATVVLGAATSSAGGVIITLPPRSTDVGIKKVPDAAHPYIAPGPNDQRGPCPALNTLANHGYIPRNGIASFEEILAGTREGFNMDRDLAGFLAGFSMMARGNAYLNKLSIGSVSPQIPVVPGAIDGPAPPGGIAKHDRFEGDVSMTRQDFNNGDDVHFQIDLFDEFLSAIAEFGDDDPVHGPASIVNMKVMQEFKFQRFQEAQAADATVSFHSSRIASSYNEAAFILTFFANGTDGLLSKQALTSIFQNQTFAPNWFRRSSPGTFDFIVDTAAEILAPHTIQPGANVNGVYVVDPPNNDCNAAYSDFVLNNLPHTLNNVTNPTFKKNIQTLLSIVATPFGCPELLPAGPVGQ